MNNPFKNGRVYCGSIREEDIGKRVTVCGWVARARDIGGYGLGLSILQTLCRHNGCKITVESTAETGTAFTLSFPL